VQATSAQPLDIGLQIHHLGEAADEHAPPGSGLLAGGAAHVVAGRRGLVFAFRLGERAAWRLLATRPGLPTREADLRGER
jgi:hypothetical protein